jgi:hypothetical protein
MASVSNSSGTVYVLAGAAAGLVIGAAAAAAIIGDRTADSFLIVDANGYVLGGVVVIAATLIGAAVGFLLSRGRK